MRDWHRAPRLAVGAVAVGLSLGVALLAVSEVEAADLPLPLYLLANAVVFLDFIDFLARLYLRRSNAGSATHSPASIALDASPSSPQSKRSQLRPYAIVLSVYNAQDSIDTFLDAMRTERERCWIIDDASTDDTVMRIRQNGWRCIEGRRNRKKPGALRRLLEVMPAAVETVVVVDPDISISPAAAGQLSDLQNVIFDFQRSGMAAVCPRIAVREDGLLSRFQVLEYGMAFSLGRMSLGDCGINSGISIYRRDALAATLTRHSMSVYAEDFENSTILLGSGERIYYDERLVVTTDAPTTLRGWSSQRVGWSFGLVKVYHERFAEIRKIAARRASAAYQFLGYTGVSCLLLHPVKIGSLLFLALSLANAIDGLLALDWIPNSTSVDPAYFVAAYLKYTALAAAALLVALPRHERRYALPIVPLYFFYALLHIIPTTVGYANWLSLRAGGRRLFADHYQDDASLRLPQPALPGK